MTREVRILRTTPYSETSKATEKGRSLCNTVHDRSALKGT